MNSLLLGIDIGTSSCKAALFEPDGTVAAQKSGEYNVFYPQAGWAEQNPDDWWKTICSSIKSMLDQNNINPSRIVSVGVAGQSWSAIPLSKDGKCLCNTPIWMDTRSDSVCMELDRNIGADKIFNICGNPLKPAYTLPKILWYKQNMPEVYTKTDKILSSNGYITYMLTGNISQDISQAYGYHCFDIRYGKWDDMLCTGMGIKKSLLPDIVPCHAIIGKVTNEAAKACGLSAGTPVVAGGLDAACGTLGAGVINSGETQEQGGQAGGMSICTDSYIADPRLILSYHVVPDKWLLQGGTVGGGGVVKWLNSKLWPDFSYRDIDEECAKTPEGSDGLIFLPYMAGERSPIWNAKAKGVFYGLDFTKTRGHIIRSALEGVAYALRHNLEAAEQAGAKVERLRAMGGSANSRIWTQIKADISGKPIEVPASDTATTLGAAMLAGAAIGIYRDFNEAAARCVKITRSHEPNYDNKAVYDADYKKYLLLYENLKGMMK